MTELEDFSCTHRPGSTTFRATKGNLTAILHLWIADDNAMVWELDLEGQDSEVDVFAMVEISQMDWSSEANWGYYCRHMHQVKNNPEVGGPVYFSHHGHHFRLKEIPLMALTTDGQFDSFDGSRDEFYGPYGSENLPAALTQGRCSNSELTSGEPCLAGHRRITLKGGTGHAKFFLHLEPNTLADFPGTLQAAVDRAARLRDPHWLASQKVKSEEWWRSRIEAFRTDYPDVDIARMANTWGSLQCIQTGRYSRAVSASAPGVRGVGFRDTAQDMVSVATMDPGWARETLLLLLRHQYQDGHALHYLYPNDPLPPVTSVHCDNHLWLPFAAYAITAESGDPTWLSQKVPYYDGEGEGVTVLEHLRQALRFTDGNLGSHGLPLIYRSDWNDIIGKFSQEGRGESVMAAMQYVVAAGKVQELCGFVGESSDEIEAGIAKMRQAIEQHCWDGEWWIRAFDDDGHPIGSAKNEFGKIWLNSQTWSVLAEVGTREQQIQAMDSVHRLLGTEVGLRKLAPGFATYPHVTDAFSGYGPGCGENGAVFCHAHAWAVMAEAQLGRPDQAWKLYRQLVPHLALQKVGLKRYSSEPYAFVSNIVGPESIHFGWANVSQITGAATWMHVALTQDLLGVKARLGGLQFSPVLEAGVTGYSVERVFRGEKHRFTV
jgi:cellobiose phosphorylase